MKEVWNDCPICGEELLKITNSYFQCVYFHYDISFVANIQQKIIYDETFSIGEYRILRKQYTYIYSLYHENTIKLRYVLPFNKFSSVSKIQKLLLLL